MSEQYSQELTKIAVAKTATALGFKKADEAVLECLADVVKNFVTNIAAETKFSTENCGRMQPGVMDALPVLENIKAGRYSWKHLQAFGLSDKPEWCEPFPVTVPSFPVPSLVTPTPSLAASDPSVIKSKEELPPQLPPYPPAHTYSRYSDRREPIDKQKVPQEKERETEVQYKKRKLQKNRKVQSALHTLVQAEAGRAVDIFDANTSSITPSAAVPVPPLHGFVEPLSEGELYVTPYEEHHQRLSHSGMHAMPKEKKILLGVQGAAKRD